MLTEHLTPAASSEHAQHQISVLLVDDDDQYAAYVRSVFDETTSLLVDLHHVRYLEHIQPALQTKAFSVVLLDVNLPDGNGLNWLQRHHEELQAAVVVLTGNPDYSLRDNITDTAQDFILKSDVQPDQLVRAVRYAAERERSRQQLVRSREYFQSLIEQARDLITVVDEQGIIRYQSPASRSMLGLDSSFWVGGPIVDMVIPSDRRRLELLLRELFTGDSDSVSGEFASRHADGSTRTLDIVASRIASVGESHRAVCNARDVTDRREAEETLRARDEQLRQAMKMEAIGRLAGGIAHDFSYVLTVIIGACERLQDGIGANVPSSGADVGTILNNCRRAASLTRQLLAFSRKQTLSPQPLNLGHLVTSSGPLLRPLIGEHIELHMEIAADVYAIEADPVQMEQVLLNLAINARDAMPSGGRLVLRVANTLVSRDFARSHPPIAAGPYVLLEVQDTGCGMSPGTKARAFDPFFTTKGLEGTGLGLSTVYGIVKQSGGFIWISSEPGEGTTFTIHMPPTLAIPLPTDAPPAPARRATQSATILLTEDDPDVRQMLAALLHSAGHTVLEAENPDRALESAAAYTGHIDLLLTDVVMPGGTGRDLARRMASVKPDLRVLYISGYPEYGGSESGSVLEPGVPFLAKPFTRDVLIQKINDMLA
jgi:two-component system cell cycle sensor histidine kinase/response regulator CckA